MNILAIILLAILIYFIYITNISSIKPATSTAVALTDVSNSMNGSGNISNAIDNVLNNVSTGTNTLVNDIINVANANKLNPAILYGIVTAEQGSTNPSNWNVGAYNPNDPTGAYGLTQILGSTAESFNVNPSMLLQSATTALNTTAQYINKYVPTETNSISAVAGAYNGGPGIFGEIQNGSVNANVANAVQTYIDKATNGYNYFNNTYNNLLTG